MHGAGFTGSGEDHLASIVEVEATGDGRVRVLTASTEIGQGTNTIFSQIAAEALGVEPDVIDVVQPDTSIVPNSGPTVASRTCMVVGKLVESAATGLRTALTGAGLLADAYSSADFQRACRTYVERDGPLRASAQYQPTPGLKWDDERYVGDAYGSYAWAVYVAEVSVDTVTCEIHRPDKLKVASRRPLAGRCTSKWSGGTDACRTLR
jgi:CO/xanthine dehydrogenase Mo-binding subunit